MDALQRLAVPLVSAAIITVSPSASWADHLCDLDCFDFPTQQEAQDHMDSHPGDPDNLDWDLDDIACECNPIEPYGPTPAGCDFE